MDNWFKSKWFVRIISLAFAILLYVFVSFDVNGNQLENDSRIPDDSEDIETIENFPLDIKIDAEKYVVSGVPEYVKVQLQGSPGVLVPAARQQNFNAYVDLEDLGPGKHTVEVKYSNVPDNLDVYIEPKEINVIIEERASEEFTVNVDFINTDKLPEGFELGSSEVQPKKVTITSSKNIIDQIGIVKVFVDVAGLKESIDSREVPVNVYDSQGNELNVNVKPQNVVVSAELLNPSKTVPVAVPTTGELPKDYSLASIKAGLDEVEVFATNSILADIDKVQTEEINLSDITKSQTIEAKLAPPDGATIPETDTVEVEIELEQTKTIEDVAIDVDNLSDGQELSFLTPEDAKMKVDVAGSEKDISKLNAEKIKLTVDAEGLDEGEHKLPIVIVGPENVKITPEMEQVTIEIK
ncbi:CdaR family protein [Virgibacillus phasianinus]|nr:CdaR family protein [Virgibacillus phasianinus]